MADERVFRVGDRAIAVTDLEGSSQPSDYAHSGQSHLTQCG